MTRVFKFKDHQGFYVVKDDKVFSYFKSGNKFVKDVTVISLNTLLKHVNNPEYTQLLLEVTEEDLLKAIITHGIIERGYE